jgi:hypothetical protein
LLVHRLILRTGVGFNVMRKYLASLPFVLSLLAAAPLAASTPAAADDSHRGTTVAVQQVRAPLAGLRDEATMVLVGTALIGLAAAVRRAA